MDLMQWDNHHGVGKIITDINGSGLFCDGTF